MGRYINYSNIRDTLIGLCVVALIPTASWLFAEVRNMPEKYTQHHEMIRITAVIDKLDKKVDDIKDFISCLPEKFPYKVDVQRKDAELDKRLDNIDEKLNDLLMLQLGKKTQRDILEKRNGK